MSFTFSKATKFDAKARIALAGPSGSGKTYTALSLATSLGERVAVIDTERGSASKYADLFNFDTLVMDNYDPRELVAALDAAQQADYDVVVVDSLSHFWMGKGGMLEMVDHAAKRAGGNSFGGWKDARPHERRMVDAMLAYRGHVIATMRTKTEYIVEENERGKKTPRKIGLKPEQRDGIEYEFDIVGDLDLDNTLIISKSRCPDLTGLVINRAGAETAQQISAWLHGAPPPPPPSREDVDAWIGDLVERIAAATLDELRGPLWTEISAKTKTGFITAGEHTDIVEQMTARKRILEQDAAVAA